jgi:hypothetical protein
VKGGDPGDQWTSYSQTRACALVGMRIRTLRRKQSHQDDGVLAAAEHRWFGYRRLNILLRRYAL